MSIEPTPTISGIPVRRWKRYAAYRDSGVEWIGEVPEGWDVIPLRWNSQCPSGDGIPSENIETLDDEKNVVPVIGGNGVMGYTNKGNIDYPVLAIGRVGALCGNVHVVQPPAWITDNAFVFDADAGVFDLIFLSEVLRSRNLNEIASKTAQPPITGTQVRDQRVPHPKIEEQRAIAAFLDNETGRIDVLIEKKERQVELLQEKRAALISHVVTKGLDPDVKMKDSGVEWLGEVPEHWPVKRLRFHILINPTKLEVHGLAPDTTVSFVPMEAVGEYGGIRLGQTRPIEEVAAGYTYFRDGDVAVAKITPCFENVKGAVVKGLKNGIGFGTTELHVLRPSYSIDRHFLFYLTISYAFRKLGESEMYGSAGQKRVPEDFIKNLKHPIPTLAEQRTIATFLYTETGRIDILTTKIQESISKLREYRTALISAAVTGKIDVREDLVS